MIDWTAVGAIWPMFLVIVTAIGAGFVWVLREEARSKANEVRSLKAEKKAEEVSLQLSTFRERVAQEYATIIAVTAIRAEVLDAINRLGDRFDRFFEAKHGA